jgi:hypothetical protein
MDFAKILDMAALATRSQRPGGVPVSPLPKKNPLTVARFGARYQTTRA